MSDASHLLIVEDDLVDSLSIRRELRRHVLDCQMTVLPDADAALEHLKTRMGADELLRTVVSLDLNLPGRSGFWLLERMQEDPQLRKIPVVVITGSDEERDQQHAMQLGARAAFPKSRLAGAVDALALALGLLPDARAGGSPFRHILERGRALVVEDDRADAIQIQRQIEHVAGPEWMVDVAHDGDAAIDAVARRDYEVVFLDVNLPRRSGPAVLRELRVRTGGDLPPVVAVTGSGNETVVREMFHLGVTDYFTKSMFNTASLSRLLGLITVRRRRVTEQLLEEFERERDDATEGTPARALTMVGGSAGALQIATRAFHRRLEPGDGAIVYVSHASRRADSSLLPVLRNADPRFRWARPDALVESGGLYVAPPGFDLGFAGERFRLVVADSYPGTVPSLDVAYRLAAETYGNRLTIVVLAGLNDDGAAGAVRATEAGGQVLVVDPRELGSSGEMGRSVIGAVPAARVIGVADLEEALETSMRR